MLTSRRVRDATVYFMYLHKAQCFALQPSCPPGLCSPVSVEGHIIILSSSIIHVLKDAAHSAHPRALQFSKRTSSLAGFTYRGHCDESLDVEEGLLHEFSASIIDLVLLPSSPRYHTFAPPQSSPRSLPLCPYQIALPSLLLFFLLHCPPFTLFPALPYSAVPRDYPNPSPRGVPGEARATVCEPKVCTGIGYP